MNQVNKSVTLHAFLNVQSRKPYTQELLQKYGALRARLAIYRRRNPVPLSAFQAFAIWARVQCF